MKRLILPLLGCLVLFLGTGCGRKNRDSAVTTNGVDSTQITQTESVQENMEQPLTPPTPDPNPKNAKVRVKTTMGDMVIALYDETPGHRDNFLMLVERGFYDSLLFHRVIRNFMIQGGDPNSRNAGPGVQLGIGGPGYTIPAEFNAKLIHKKGALAAARQSDFANPTKSSSGSQFYIVQGQVMNDMQLNQMQAYVQQKNPNFTYTEEQRNLYKTVGGTAQLDMDYTVFGEVIEGLDVIDKIAATATGQGDRPVQNVVMSMEVVK